LRARISTVALIALGGLALASCGGDDEPDDTTTDAETTAETTAATAAAATTTTTATGEPPLEEVVARAAGVSIDDVECGAEGLEAVAGAGGTCAAGGTRYVVAGYGERLELDTPTARLTRLDTQKKVSGSYLKPRAAKN